ncbi:MAG: histidine kinase [Variovorax sp.]|nr:histidine kinase [Variovorax sp.]
MLAWLALAAFLLAAPPAAAHAPRLQVDAVQSGWAAASPPADGWTPVTLPDTWTARWPGFDGVVWYRLRWSETPDAARLRPVGLMIDAINMAGAVYLNGSLIGGDGGLVEPLSRSWNLPRYWVLDAPLLRPGANELLVRVSGLATYQPSLGSVTVGEPDAVHTQFLEATFTRRTSQMIGIGLILGMGVLYGMFWLFRRQEVPYGWFGLFSLLWVVYSYNNVAVSPWPFDSTEGFQRLNHLAMFASAGAFLMFALTYSEIASKAVRRAALALTACGVALLLLAPTSLQDPVRDVTVLATLALYFTGCGVIMRNAIRTRRTEATVLSLCLLIPVAGGIHDTLVFFEWLPGSSVYIASISASATMLGISFALTWRMVKGMRLVENFNAALQQRVEQATRELAQGLRRQHEAELEQTRLAERLSLVRDLHDGLGMTLSSHIHTLGNRDDTHDGVALWALREVNDDLRLIIESSSFEDGDDLAQRLAPLRHRCTRLLDAADIECHWMLDGLPDLRLDGKRALDFLRVVQEGLANVLKHSGATQVDVRIEARQGELSLTIRDNGRGFASGSEAPPSALAGMGLRNMQARASRLGGTLAIHSGDAGTVLQLRCPIDATTAA